MSQDFNENVIEFIEHEKTAFVTFSEKKFMNRIRSIAKKNPECVILDEQTDSIYAKIPTSWVKIQPPARLPEGNKEARRIQFAQNIQNYRESSMKNEAKTDSNVKEV